MRVCVAIRMRVRGAKDDINTILEIDESVLPYLNYPAGIALEREDVNATFVVSRARGFTAGERRAEKNKKGQ